MGSNFTKTIREIHFKGQLNMKEMKEAFKNLQTEEY